MIYFNKKRRFHFYSRYFSYHVCCVACLHTNGGAGERRVVAGCTAALDERVVACRCSGGAAAWSHVQSRKDCPAQLRYHTMSCTRSIFIPFSLTPYNCARPYRDWNTVDAYSCLQHADDTVLRCYCNPSLDSGTRLFPSSSTNASIIIEQAAFSGGVGGIGCELPAAECPAFLAAVQAGLTKELRVRASPV